MYDEKYNGYIKRRIGHMKLRDVKNVHLQKILNEQAGMSASHVKKLRMVMQEMFKRARQSRLIVYDPAELLELPSVKQGVRRSITEAERTAILEVAEYHQAGLWVLTLLYTGMRPGETAALTWADVDFKNNEIHVHVAKESGSAAIKGTKTAAGGAEVYRNKIIKSVVSPDLTSYCLRHTFCTDLQRAGVALNVAKELMGHSDVSVTANIYTHKDNDVLHAGIALLEGGGNKKSSTTISTTK